ncbi:hypothetical protein B0H12DRAFT_1239073 [Mycena haematopus]|nr:hypothetical protein B0H12DRAFT_1239073 [Mycena haematopus]
MPLCVEVDDHEEVEYMPPKVELHLWASPEDWVNVVTALARFPPPRSLLRQRLRRSARYALRQHRVHRSRFQKPTPTGRDVSEGVSDHKTRSASTGCYDTYAYWGRADGANDLAMPCDHARPREQQQRNRKPVVAPAAVRVRASSSSAMSAGMGTGRGATNAVSTTHPTTAAAAPQSTLPSSGRTRYRYG